MACTHHGSVIWHIFTSLTVPYALPIHLPQFTCSLVGYCLIASQYLHTMEYCSSILAWEIPWMEEPGAKSRTGLSNFTFTFIQLLKEGVALGSDTEQS